MKKSLIILLGLTLIIASCNKTAFVKKLTGTWSLDRYLFAGQDRTLYFDTTFRSYKLNINEDNLYSLTYNTFAFNPGSYILSDTLGFDTVNQVYVINLDTINYIDTIITPSISTGEWTLLNSDEDLQLRDDTTNAVSIYRILELSKSSLKLRKGNEEFYFGK